MAILSKKGFNEAEKNKYRDIIRRNIVEAYFGLFEGLEKLGINMERQESWDHKDFMMDINVYDEEDVWWNDGIVPAARFLWSSEPAIQTAFDQKSKFQLEDNVEYLMTNLERIGAADYVPTPQDILFARFRTTGINEQHFTFQNSNWTFVDVGGQKNERRKWIHCFSDVRCLIFVFALSEYDQTLLEDETTNRFEEALSVWSEVVNNKAFKSTAIVLFLNKDDIFREKLPRFPMEDYQTDFKGGGYDAAIEFVKEKFQERTEGNQVYWTHVTTATNSENMTVIWHSVREAVLHNNLNQAGLWHVPTGAA